MGHDEQKAETEETFARLSRRYILPAEAPLGFQFIPLGETSDRDGFATAASALGYEAMWFGGEDDEEEADAYLELEGVIAPLTVEEVWRHESLLTELGLRHGFAADGWGFLSPLDEAEGAPQS